MNEHAATRWDVYRDANGQPVTISEDQMHAIWHAINVVDQVRRAEGCRSFDDQARVGNWLAEFYKSRLLGRMLLDGKPPYDEKPPTEVAACAYWLWDDDPGSDMNWSPGTGPRTKKQKPYRVLCANGYSVELEAPPSGLWIVDLQGCGPHRLEHWDGLRWVEIAEPSR